MSLSRVGRWFRNAVGWWRDGLVIALPDGLVNRPGRPALLFISYSNDEASGARYATRNWFGTCHWASAQSDGEKTQIDECLVQLADNDVYVTTLTLPNTSPENMRRMVRLRLNELSPFPSDEVVFDIREAGRASDGRRMVEVAMCRRHVIASLVSRFEPEFARVHIGWGRLDEPRLDFIFAKHFDPLRAKQVLRRTGVLAAAVSLVALIAAFGFSQNRLASEYEEARNEMVAQIRAETLRQNSAVTLAQAARTVDQNVSIDEIIVVLQALDEFAELGFRAESVNVSADGVRVNGMVMLADSERLETFDSSDSVRVRLSPVAPGRQFRRATIQMKLRPDERSEDY